LKQTPKFVALLPVRDEGDIIGQCLERLLEWADAIYVFDTGSVDETYDIVGSYARLDSRVRCLGRAPVYYNENRVRGYLFARAREVLSNGDWFLRVDADEFHHVTPQEFVRERLNPRETVVYHQYYNFELTEGEVAQWEAGRETLEDRRRPISDRRRRYTVSVYAEPRMCQYRASMRWPVAVSFPYNAGLVARARFPIRHYPHRDPLQLARRCRLRAVMMADAQNGSHWVEPEKHHWSTDDWRLFVKSDEEEDLRYWEAGTQLSEVAQYNHLATGRKRVAQVALYASGLAMYLDRYRSAWVEGMDAPLAIAEETQALLKRELLITVIERD
jgi:glycosyltransferase involved in cell wall biosynthesis